MKADLPRATTRKHVDGGRTLGEDNGLTYSGIVDLSQSGSTNTVTLSGDGVGISTLTLTATVTESSSK